MIGKYYKTHSKYLCGGLVEPDSVASVDNGG